MYDYLIVGSGLFGSVFAHEMKKRGKKCLVIERRNHIGGNIFSDNYKGIEVHKYGPHIFHTSLGEIWEYVNQLTPFRQIIFTPIAKYQNSLYNLPFNMNTFYQMWGTKTPAEAQAKLKEQQGVYADSIPCNLEEQALKLVGHDIYMKLIKGYTEKQWGCSAKELPAFIINRLPVRFRFDNNYFNDDYQGIPKLGYTVLAKALLEGIEVKCGIDFLQAKSEWLEKAHRVVFTGQIDTYFNQCFGALEYRSLRFEEEVLQVENYQGNAVVNYTEKEVPFTRVIEHKHFMGNVNIPLTVITREYPQMWTKERDPFYPINNERNNKIYEQYNELAKREEKIIFGGRLGEYKYYDMDKVIESALKKVKTCL